MFLCDINVQVYSDNLFLPQCHGHVLPQNSITCASLLFNHEGNKFLMYVLLFFVSRAFSGKKFESLVFPRSTKIPFNNNNAKWEKFDHNLF